MPKAQERALKKVAARLARQGKLRRKAGETVEEAKGRFVYGTMINQGTWHPRRKHG